MEGVGQSESTHKIILQCKDPLASFESGASSNGWNYSLEYSDNNIIISRHDSKQQFVLNHNKYKNTLKRWLKKRKRENRNNWDDEYGKWKVCRPKEEARQIIQGILHAVCELHSHKYSHGFLYHLENFAIQDKDLVIGGDHKKSKHVFLIHENHEFSGAPTIHHEFSGAPAIHVAQYGDRLAVSNVIFGQILGATNKKWRYPQDLRHLRHLLEQTNVSTKEWELIVNHPSLWHWKSRFDYPERVWMHFMHSYTNANQYYQDMKDVFNNISVSGWGNKIPINSPLMCVYNRGNYGDRAFNLLHYLRNVRVHYKENVRKNSPDEVFFKAQFVESKITEIFELFLVHLYSKMCEKNIYI